MNDRLSLAEIHMLLMDTEVALNFLHRMTEYHVNEGLLKGYEIGVMLAPHIAALKKASEAVSMLVDLQEQSIEVE